MPYNFNPHRHVKIWLSKDENTFLNLENRVRLVKMRDLNPTDEIYFVYDSSLLSPQAKKELESFCQKYNIISKDVQKDVIPHCHSEEEKNLIKIYNDDISNLDKGGNPAVGSDILRWLKPVYELGTYTDFDVHVDTSKLPGTVTVDKPLLLSLGSCAIQGDVEHISVNNDTIAVVDSDQALSDIRKVQKMIYDRCSEQPNHDDNFIEEYVSTSRTRLYELLNPFFAEIILNSDPNAKVLETLSTLTQGKTARQVRELVLEQTANNPCFSKDILKQNEVSSRGLDEGQIIKKAAELQRTVLEQQLGWIPWLLLSKTQYKRIQDLALIHDDDELLTRLREETRNALLKSSVVYSSGPGALGSALFEKLYYKKDHVCKEIAPFSLASYGLDKAFSSENSLPLHATAQTVRSKMQTTEIGKINDLSWLQEGQKATAIREQKIIAAQSRLPQDIHEMREKIRAHIEKIKADLGGCVSFYRQKERHAKIDALKKILGHFTEQSFDAGAFNAALAQYRTKDISASIGKSKTKELIDEMELFSQRAKHYMLTDEQGRVEIIPTSLTNPSPK